MLHTPLLGYRKNGKPIHLIQGGAPTPAEIIGAKRDALLAEIAQAQTAADAMAAVPDTMPEEWS